MQRVKIVEPRRQPVAGDGVAGMDAQDAPAQPAQIEQPFRALQGQGVKFFARFALVDDSAWKVLVHQAEGEDLLTVQDERTARVLLSVPGNSERFL